MAGEEPPAQPSQQQLQQQDGLAERLRAALGAITIDKDAQPKQSYAFWGTQPVAQFNEQPNTAVRIAAASLSHLLTAASAGSRPLS
jgi:hypothetical protein